MKDGDPVWLYMGGVTLCVLAVVQALLKHWVIAAILIVLAPVSFGIAWWRHRRRGGD